MAGEVVLVSLGDGVGLGARRNAELFVLNATGELLWELLQDPRTLGELAQKLSNTYAIDQARARADAEAFTSTMIDMDILRLVEA